MKLAVICKFLLLLGIVYINIISSFADLGNSHIWNISIFVKIFHFIESLGVKSGVITPFGHVSA
jgi:hypothetical protein